MIENLIKKSSWVDLNYESEGFRILMALCSYFLNDPDKSEKIFVMDEPFTNIHPKAQRHVSRMLQSLSQRFQIIYATHSPHLLPERDKIICTLTETAGDLSICKFEEYPLNLFYDLSPLALDTVEKIERGSSTINVFVEGKTDVKIYEKFFELEGILDRINVNSMKGSGSIHQYANMYATIDNPSLFILDPGEKVKNLEGLRQHIEKHENLFLLELPYEENNHMKKGIENLMPNHVIEKASERENQGVQLCNRRICLGKHVEVYDIVNKVQLAEFFVNEAAHTDYGFFSPVIDEVTKIRKEFGI